MGSDLDLEEDSLTWEFKVIQATIVVIGFLFVVYAVKNSESVSMLVAALIG